VTLPALLPRDRPRLKDQCSRLGSFYLRYPGWYALEELVRAIGATSEAGVSARLRQMANEQGWRKSRRIRKGNLWEYSLLPPLVGAQQELRL
jgi:hypothetical protein